MVWERGQMRRGMRCWWHEALCNWTCERGSRYDRRLEEQKKGNKRRRGGRLGKRTNKARQGK